MDITSTEWNLLIAGVAVLGAVTVATAIVTHRRHRRMQKRAKRLEYAIDGLRKAAVSYPQFMLGRELAHAGGAGAPASRRVPRFYAFRGEDLVLWYLFQDQPQGTFVEIGGYDGVTCSTTIGFEDLGWRGVLVDAQADLCEMARKARPNSKVYHAACGDADGGQVKFTIAINPAHAGLPQGHTATSFVSSVGDATKPSRSAELREVSVPTRRLDSVIREAGFASIDIGVIDVEGFEFQVLAGWDFSKVPVRALMIETCHVDHQRLDRDMEQRGFVRALPVAHNTLYVRKDEAVLLQRAADLAERKPWECLFNLEH